MTLHKDTPTSAPPPTTETQSGEPPRLSTGKRSRRKLLTRGLGEATVAAGAAQETSGRTARVDGPGSLTRNTLGTPVVGASGTGGASGVNASSDSGIGVEGLSDSSIGVYGAGNSCTDASASR